MNVCVGLIIARKSLLIKSSNQGFTSLPFPDVYRVVRSCQKCQLFAEKKRLAPLPLLLVFVEEPFRQWGLDFIGEINPPSSG